MQEKSWNHDKRKKEQKPRSVTSEMLWFVSRSKKGIPQWAQENRLDKCFISMDKQKKL